MNDGCGAKRSELLRTSSQLSLWRKIPSAFSVMVEAARSEDSSGRLPRSGTYVNGTLLPLPTLVLHTADNESGSSAFVIGMVHKPTHHVPTPTASDYIERESTSTEVLNFETNKSVSLDRWVRMWPTPTAGDCHGSGSRNTETSKAHAGISLTDAVRGDGGRGRLLPTPNTVDAKGGTRKGKGQEQLCHLVGGSLNPTWVEWLMGFPAGWTDLGA